MQLTQKFFRNYGPTTPIFKKFAKDYKLEVLSHTISDDSIERVIKITLDDIPVLGAVSNTKLSDKTFANILQNAGSIPIGEQLFALDSKIVRDKMVISLMAIKDIANPLMRDFILQNSQGVENIYVRVSQFVCNRYDEMYLTEFATPLLEEFLAKHNF